MIVFQEVMRNDFLSGVDVSAGLIPPLFMCSCQFSAQLTFDKAFFISVRVGEGGGGG